MLLCQIFFSLLQCASLETQLRTGVLGIADTAAGTLADDLSMGLRLGKKLQNFYNLRNLLQDARHAFPMAHDICVTDTQGRLIASVPAPSAGQAIIPIDKSVLAHGPGRDRHPDANGFYYAGKPLFGRNRVPEGYVLIRVQESTLKERITPAIGKIAGNALLVMAVTVVAVLLIIWRVPFFTAQGAVIRKSLYLSFGLLFAVVLTAGSVRNHITFRQNYFSIAMENADTLSRTLRGTLSRTIGKGVPVALLKSVEDYFETAAAKTAGTVLIELYRPDAALAFSSRRAFSGEKVVPGSFIDAPLREFGSPVDAAPWVLRTGLSQKAFDAALRESALNAISLCIISLTLLFELLLLFRLLLERRAKAAPDSRVTAAAGTVDSERYNTVLRIIFFVFMLAVDMSITFIPLRMAQLPDGFPGVPRDVILGLPVSVEVTMAGIFIFLTGKWVSRCGAALPMRFGFIFAAAGYLASALASGPMGFILARALAGAGYGTAIMAAQAYVFRSGGLAGLFAGVFAGSLCGGAAGSMLAEKLGFVAAFHVSAAMLLLLAVLPYALLRQGDTTREDTSSGKAGKTRFSRTLKAVGSGRFLALAGFALIPATFVVTGFTKYFMPVFLSRAEVAQADIGRVYMVYCLVLIYVGPFLGRVVHRARHKAVGVMAGCLLGAFGILPLAVFDSLWAAAACAFILGLANAVNIPAHGEYLLRLDITRQVGSNQALGLLNVVERVGQALAPVAIGLMMAGFAIHTIALWGGLFLILLAWAFYATREREPA